MNVDAINQLVEQLESNTLRVAELEQRVNNIKESRYYTAFNKEHKRDLDIKSVKKIISRVLEMRLTLLDKISKATLIEIELTKEENKQLK